MPAKIAKGSLRPNCRRLVELMRQLHFGQIVGLRIDEGDPVYDPPPRLVYDKKLGSEPAPRPVSGREDFLLKQQVVELFALFDQLRNGMIDVIEVKNGLPFRVQHSEPLA
jgi:hypothetical protein